MPHQRQTDQPRVFTLRTDSYDCPDCGRVVVATDDLVVELAAEHDCPPS